MYTPFPTLPPRIPFVIGQKPKQTKLSCHPQKEGAHTCCGAGLFAVASAPHEFRVREKKAYVRDNRGENVLYGSFFQQVPGKLQHLMIIALNCNINF